MFLAQGPDSLAPALTFGSRCWPTAGRVSGGERGKLGREIHEKFEGYWYSWHFGRYVRAMQNLHDAFARKGSRCSFYAQGVPLLPGTGAEVVAQLVRGTNDDATWGMLRESVTLTTARQMAEVAFTPSLLMATHLCWGYNSPALNNPQWHEGIGTTEPSRRHLFDRAFRGVLRPDGSYTSMHAYGYKFNVGAGLTLASQEFDARQRVKELHSLLTPEEPLGAGMVLSTAWREGPANFRFECGDPMGFPECRHLTYATWYLQDAGMSIPFAANAACLQNWQGSAPLILGNLHQFSARKSPLSQSWPAAACVWSPSTIRTCFRRRRQRCSASIPTERPPTARRSARFPSGRSSPKGTAS